MAGSWTAEELAKIESAEEIEVAARRADGSLRDPVTIWAVRDGDAVYVRSAVRGKKARWFRGVTESHGGRISAGGVYMDVTFATDHEHQAEVDAAYRTKYHRYAGRILDIVLTAEAKATTLRV